MTDSAIRWTGVLQVLSCVLVSPLISACGSIVYKDASTSYIVAGRAATKSIADGASTLAAAQDKIKAARIVTDSSCQIGEPRLFLRDSNASAAFVSAFSQRPDIGNSPDCTSLKFCQINPASRGCASVCYSAREGNCINNLEEGAATTLTALSGMKKDAFFAAMQPFSVALVQVEYGRATAVQSVLVKSSLDALARYLDLLDKLSQKRTSDFATDAKKLSSKLIDAEKNILEVTKKRLSAVDQATQTKISGAIGAVAKLTDDIRLIVQNEQDATAIQELVIAQSSDVAIFIQSVRDVAIGDSLLGAVFNNLANEQFRANLQVRYSASKDRYERGLLLADIKQYQYSDGTLALDSVGSLFDAMEASHRSLIQLVKNPSDKQQQQLANASFQTFKSIAEDVASLLNSLL